MVSNTSSHMKPKKKTPHLLARADNRKVNGVSCSVTDNHSTGEEENRESFSNRGKSRGRGGWIFFFLINRLLCITDRDNLLGLITLWGARKNYRTQSSPASHWCRKTAPPTKRDQGDPGLRGLERGLENRTYPTQGAYHLKIMGCYIDEEHCAR